MKRCSKCKSQRPDDQFSRSSTNKSGLACWCKRCEAEKAKARRKTPERYRGPDSKECPRCSIVKKFCEFYDSPFQKDGLYGYCKACQLCANAASYSKNKEKVAFRVRQRKEADPRFAMHVRILGLVRKSLDRRALKTPISSVTGAFWQAVGYTSQTLAEHIQRQFLEGMTWENRSEWHIDHIVPICSFTYTSFQCAEFRACWGLPNLRPMWARENLRKGGQSHFLL